MAHFAHDRRLCAVATAIAAVVLASTNAAASSRIVSDQDLARASAAAVHGRVVSIDAAWDPAANTIYTRVALDVSQAWGLSGTPARVVLKQLGGVVGGAALLVGGQARFEVGEDVFVFLDVRPRDRTLSVAGLEQGKWTLTAAADSSAAMARDVRGQGGAVVSRDFTSMSRLATLAAGVGTRASAADAVLDPGAAPLSGNSSERAAYTLLSSTPARWHEADSGTPVYVDTETGGHPAISGGGLSQLERAAGMWAAAGSLHLLAGGSRGARCFENSDPSTGRISVTYGDPCGEIADESPILAIGGAYYSSSDVRTVNGTPFWRMVKGMIVTDNPEWKFRGLSTGCYEELLAHELGHAIGFGHAAERPAVMYPSISSECWNRTTSLPLQADELSGMAAVYPRAVSAIDPPAPPASLGSSVNGTTVTVSWAPPAGGAAPAAYQLHAGSAAGLSDYGVATIVGTTSIAVADVPNGIYFVRLVAVNAGGPSAPTPDHVISVQARPPDPPYGVLGSVGPGSTATLLWRQAETGGTPTGYVLLVGYAPGATTHQIPVTGTTFAASGVPPGTYYARIVAVNGAGASAPSTEVTLVVR